MSKENQQGSKVRLPGEGEMLAKIIELVGDDRARAVCQDGKIRLVRIPGKYRKKMWLRVGDYVIIAPWDFKPDRADLVYKYEKNEVNELRQSGYAEILNQLDELAG
ncbi:MAG: translation initiation factor aIF-1A [Vulcanisaeta sp.]|jgi:translation initiation factor 1A|nr:translation initiation factor aIF-1A [Vulcanisaeta sp.]MCG2869238.1 translation initiation factor aIF-1A [Vulcanisaeta sp.]MCG2886590.1 translation initiation factor aIF-1A [Vulcanisaeta sp.]